MNDKKLTDKEIVKALRELLKELKGKKQLIVPEQGVKNLCYGLQNFLDLINRQKEEKEVLEARIGIYETCNARKDEAIKHLETEVKRLQAENERLNAYLDVISYSTDKIKAEAYKEFAERLKEFMHNKFKDLDEYEFEYVTARDIDNLLKEMVGEDNGKEKE